MTALLFVVQWCDMGWSAMSGFGLVLEMLKLLSVMWIAMASVVFNFVRNSTRAGSLLKIPGVD